MQIQHRSRAPGPPYHSHTRISRRAGAYRLLLNKACNKAHLHFGDLLPDPLLNPLRVAHLRRGCELLRVVYEERLGARSRPSVDGAVARARPFCPYK
jgi:hypothetical protein